MSNLRWKIVLVALTFVVFFTVGVYPILASRYGMPLPAWLAAQRLKLGLDLQGGVHIVLRVQTDDALRIETELESERLRDEMSRTSIPGTVTVVSPTEFRAEGIPADQEPAFRGLLVNTEINFDRSSSGTTHTFSMKPNIQQVLRDEAVVQARQTIERRVDELGVTEPSIARQGNDQIFVQLPGVTDVDRAKDIIQAGGLLELKIVEGGPSAARETFLRNGVEPTGMEIVPGAGLTPGEGTVYYMVRSAAAVSGRDLRNARPTIDENGRPAVAFTLTSEGARAFGRVTGENIGRQLAVIVDGRVHTAATIESRITTDGRITGSYTQETASDLALVLRSGALPASLTYLEEGVIGQTLGADSIRSGVLSSLVGLVLVVSFMLAFYKLSGVNAVVALVFNLVILLGLMAYVGAAMTLPGIAGFILTIGIGVDSNVLIFERIKEELSAQRGVRASINSGFNRVFLTLLDTHVAALIAAAFLFQFGTGPIRGFAVTLSLGLLSNLFTSIFVSRTLFEMALSRRQQTTTLSI